MEALKMGMSGVEVAALQRALAARGFDPGLVDAEFGAGTDAALRGFQLSEGLLADGVAGPRTLCALGLSASDALPNALPGVSVQIVCAMFPQTPIGNIKLNLPPVTQALADRGLHDRQMVLMALATIRAETESFRPVAEGESRFNTSPGGPAFGLYDSRRDLGNAGHPDGERYRGRGFVQLTGRANYRQFGPLLRAPLDLEAAPERAAEAEIAAELLALFLQHRELQIKDALMHGNLMAARRLVNGGSNGLDRFTDAFNRGNALLAPA